MLPSLLRPIFKPTITLHLRITYIDGGLRANNSVGLAVSEAKKLGPNRCPFLVNIGTGGLKTIKLTEANIDSTLGSGPYIISKVPSIIWKSILRF